MVHANISTSSAISSMSGLVSFYSRGLRACMHLHACIIMLARPTASVAGMREHSRSLLSRKGVACPMLYINYFKTHTCRSLPGLMGHGSAKGSRSSVPTCTVLRLLRRAASSHIVCASWISSAPVFHHGSLGRCRSVLLTCKLHLCMYAYIYIYVCVCVCRVSYTLPAVGNSIL